MLDRSHSDQSRTVIDRRLGGVFSAVATPIASDYAIDHARFAHHCRQLLDDGCHGLAVLGSTGEANSIGLNERRAALDALVEAGVSPGRLMPGTGLCAIADTVTLCRHALAHDITNVVVLPPFYYKMPSEQGLLQYYTRVVEGVGDSRLRLVLYHIPQLSAVPISASLIESLYSRFGPVIAGVKDSAGDLDHMTRLACDYPWLSVFAGADPLMLPLLRAGGSGCITATSNLIASDLRSVYDQHANANANDLVHAAQARIKAYRTLSNTYVQIPTIKAMIASRYGDNAWRRVLPPFTELTGAEAAAIAAGIDGIEAAA